MPDSLADREFIVKVAVPKRVVDIQCNDTALEWVKPLASVFFIQEVTMKQRTLGSGSPQCLVTWSIMSSSRELESLRAL